MYSYDIAKGDLLLNGAAPFLVTYYKDGDVGMRYLGQSDEEYGRKECYQHIWVHDDALKPIQLTGKILEANGFTLNAIQPYVTTGRLLYSFPYEIADWYSVRNYYVEYNTNTDMVHITDNPLIQVKYVHDFQHLLRLIGFADRVNNFKLPSE